VVVQISQKWNGCRLDVASSINLEEAPRIHWWGQIEALRTVRASFLPDMTCIFAELDERRWNHVHLPGHGISDGTAGIPTCLEEDGVIDRLNFNLGSDIPTSSLNRKASGTPPLLERRAVSKCRLDQKHGLNLPL
jgi:hypothetical protein